MPFLDCGAEAALVESVAAVGQLVDGRVHHAEDDPVAAQALDEVHLGVHAASEFVARPEIKGVKNILKS